MAFLFIYILPSMQEIEGLVLTYSFQVGNSHKLDYPHSTPFKIIMIKITCMINSAELTHCGLINLGQRWLS